MLTCHVFEAESCLGRMSVQLTKELKLPSLGGTHIFLIGDVLLRGSILHCRFRARADRLRGGVVALSAETM